MGLKVSIDAKYVASRSISEQSELLRVPENVQRFRIIANDTESIRTSRSQAGSTVAPSIVSNDDAASSSRRLPWIDQLADTPVYRRAEHYRSQSDVQRRDIPTRLHVPPARDILDEGYETRSGTTADSVHSPDHCKRLLIFRRDSTK
jgi:hypothetical protein